MLLLPWKSRLISDAIIISISHEKLFDKGTIGICEEPFISMYVSIQSHTVLVQDNELSLLSPMRNIVFGVVDIASSVWVVIRHLTRIILICHHEGPALENLIFGHNDLKRA